MSAVGNFAEERFEVEAVLKSGVFERAPGLEQLFLYVTSKFFEGAAEDIKEYNIAVEALGRSQDFDQKRDSIVRVQAHRLRERLADYYKNDGAEHPVQIAIPNGQYSPKFTFRKPQDVPIATLPEVDLLAIRDSPILPVKESSKWRKWLATLTTSSRSAETHGTYKNETWLPSVSSLAVDSIRILAGLSEGEYLDNTGRVWQRDQYFEGGSAFSFPDHLIFGTRDQRLYRSGREGSFAYHIPLKAGVYELRLYFAETTFGETSRAGFGGESTRVFDILINGKPAVKWLDVVGEAGASAANIKMFKDIAPDADGKLHLSFVPQSYMPFLNAIEITPGVPGKMQRIRMVAQSHGYIDKTGHYWEPDRYGTGGQLVKLTHEATDVADPGIFGGGRFGNLNYVIPVPPGQYGLKLYLSERWGTPENGTQFDILFNGIALERKFSILKRSGKINRGIVQGFDHLEPNYQGKLVLSLLPNPTYAFMNALEVIDQTP